MILVEVMNNLLRLKRPFIWLKRFRHRCGYGVHSPFAFNLVTQVIYEKTPYYAYKALELQQNKPVACKEGANESKKVKRLLFRLVNYIQPRSIVDAGTLSASSLYLQSGCKKADYLYTPDLSGLFLEVGIPVDFLYLHHYRNPQFVKQAFDVCVSRVTQQSLFVIEGIRYSDSMKSLWKEMQNDERTGITFDLYDVGLVFFDKTKIKQHYIVNF